MEILYDSIIIGTGPAGLSAALNLKIYQKNFVWFGSNSFSDKVQKAELIRNYPGLPDVTGEELGQRFASHIEAANLTITEKMVTNVIKNGETYMVLADNEVYEAKTLILCMGVMNAKLMEGEERLLGRGVSYCATCDGMLYKDRTIAVVCNSPKYEHEVEYLADLAAQVYYFPMYAAPTVSTDEKIPSVSRTNAADQENRIPVGKTQTLSERGNVIVSKEFPVQINGTMKTESITLKSGEVVPVDGIFCLRNAIAPTALIPGIEAENGHILVNRKQETNLPGCFAAGDCTGRPYQYTKAAGEGNVAAHSCVEFLIRH